MDVFNRIERNRSFCYNKSVKPTLYSRGEYSESMKKELRRPKKAKSNIYAITKVFVGEGSEELRGLLLGRFIPSTAPFDSPLPSVPMLLSLFDCPLRLKRLRSFRVHTCHRLTGF